MSSRKFYATDSAESATVSSLEGGLSMKLLSLILIGAFSIWVGATEPRYTVRDYDEVVRDDAVEFTFEPQARDAFQLLALAQNDCDKAILASLAYKAFDVAADEGVDYPEQIGLYTVRDVSPAEGVRRVRIKSEEGEFTIRFYPESSPCMAGSAEFKR